MARSNQPTAAFTPEPVRPRRAFEDVILRLRAAVVEGRLAVGNRLPHERELAGLFKVSRQSLREGLRMLEGFGILSARRGVGPDSGWIVSGDGTAGLSVLLDLHTSLKRIPMWDVLELREALETLSARSAVSRASAADRARLVDLAEQMAQVGEAAAFLKLDAEFHVALARCSGNALAPLFMEAIRESMFRGMLAGFEALPDWEAERAILVRDHREIANAIAAGDGEAAAASIGAHIHGFYGRALATHASEAGFARKAAV